MHSSAAREAARIAEVRRLRAFGPQSDPDLDSIAQTAAALFDVPIALVSLVDENQQWFKSTYGLTLREIPRELSICSFGLEQPDRVFLIPDTAIDPRFAAHPLVIGDPWVRFYAGAPLVSRSGFALGMLSIVDRVPRRLSSDQCAALTALATLVMRLIERRSDTYDLSVLAVPGSDIAPVAVAVFGWDREMRIISWNSAARAIFGWSAAEVLGVFPPFVLETDRAAVRADAATVMRDGSDVVRLCTVQTKDGRLLQVALGATCTIDADAGITGLSTVEVIGERIRTEHRLAMLESVVVHSTDAVIVTAAVAVGDVFNTIMYVNDAFTRLTGYTSAEAIGQTPRMLQGPATDAGELARISQALARCEPVTAEVVNYRKDGSTYWVEFSISLVRDAAGACLYFIAIERDTTVRRALETYEHDRSLVLEMAVRNEPLRTQLERIVLLLKGVIPGSVGSVVLHHDDRLVTGATDPQLPPTYVAAIEGLRIGPNAGSCGTAIATRHAVIVGDIETDDRWQNYRDLARAAGLRACWSIPFFAADGEVMGAFALYHRSPGLPTVRQMQLFEETVRFAALVVDRHRDRARLERMALYDPLTGLANRKLVQEELATAMRRAAAEGHAVAIGVLDIDRFKAINDAFGHHIGDRLLCSIAERLAKSLRDGASIGRMAGDEFILVFPMLETIHDGIDAATRLMDRFGTAFVVEGYEIFVRSSLGLAFFPETSTDMPSLFLAADKAMYAAKLRGGGLELATAPTAGSALKLLDLETDLRYALGRNEFELYYQMMFDLSDGRPVGAEALLRWNHPQLGLIGPTDFVPLAEANGTIVPIGTWVIGVAAQVARGWQDAGHDGFVSVNVSALQFDAPGLVATVVEALERTGLAPHRLHLELTESLIMRNPSASAVTLAQLKTLGVHIVIDDFGTGYSSLAYLQRFTFDALKIDRAFVRGIGGDDTLSARSEHIVAAVVGLSVALGVATIVEGVEDLAQYAFVRSCGCSVVQGFLCARPVPEALLVWRPWDSLAADGALSLGSHR